MPTLSRKKVLLSRLLLAWRNQLRLSADSEASSDEDSSDEDISYATLYLVLESRRYVTPRERVERPPSRINYYLTRMPDSDFKLHFRMPRPYFHAVCRAIATFPEFQSVIGKLQKASVEVHVMALLKILGSMDGQGHAADFLSVGGHTPESLLAKRVVTALMRIKSEVICWPGLRERREIAERIKNVSDLPNYIVLIDGTLFPLSQRPENHGEDFFSRKSSYAINGLIVCDGRERIRYENVGWPGSSHDNRVWRNCRLAQHQYDHFADNEYILGDSAYQASNVLIPAFKKCRGSEIPLKENTFNTQLAKIRIRVEHCIGTLKGIFPLLKRLRATIRNVGELNSTISLIRPAIILHNLTVNDKLPDAWIDCDEAENNEPIELPSGTNECRRAYLRDYIFDSVH
ncbi:uncharacterized protein PITG_05614 [Phytophthora infestans T30-4]|uniref:DDE Tnp4 domain-containing protein n=1 Tax=Phytophthora infestans (strain T30-4) TaxID=403677 RepID=D0N393_PHYIT|nr:uncharacterized protein PITG_05614 [Phytophthora infestans T30-4]EEY69385.1 conserved hypothetical protein [Phytophthora infestans T30-4]|eukprot:XP_002999239.1 conserved hypothetical protein [Phytophthora infestans T30-4]